MDIKKELAENQTILLLSTSSEYNNLVIDNLNKLTDKTICYVTLNKTSNSLKEIFKKHKINLDNIFFIDAITSTIKSTPAQEGNVYFVSSPSALTELSIAINKLLKKEFDYLIFDSITSLLVYQKKAPVAKFISQIVNQTRMNNTKSVFYAIKIKDQDKIINETSMFVDKVIEVK